VALIAGLGSGMGLVALVTGLHRRSIGPWRPSIVGHIAVAVDAQDLLVRVELMGDKHDPDRLRGGLLSPGDGGVAAHASLVHQVIAGRKGVSQDNASSGGMAIHAARGFGMSPRGEPPGGNVLILVTGQTEKRMAGGKPDQAEAWNGRQEQEDGNDQSPCAFGQFRYRWNFHGPPSGLFRGSLSRPWSK
jgi:hypothetical protein